MNRARLLQAVLMSLVNRARLLQAVLMSLVNRARQHVSRGSHVVSLMEPRIKVSRAVIVISHRSGKCDEREGLL